jgi:hypothetical protein
MWPIRSLIRLWIRQRLLINDDGVREMPGVWSRSTAFCLSTNNRSGPGVWPGLPLPRQGWLAAAAAAAAAVAPTCFRLGNDRALQFV